ncbi:MAG: transglutaminase-like cysteine peptidase [Rubrivivax sp.]
MIRAPDPRTVLASALLAGLASLALVVQAYDAARMNAAAAALGPQAQAGARDLQALIARIRTLDTARQLAEVNDFFNTRISWASDQEVWGVPDYFASPLQTLSRGRGDCEDFAGSKLFTLLAAGVPASRLNLAYVEKSTDERSGSRPPAREPHMVLIYLPSGAREDALVLDNGDRVIRRASERTDLEPIYHLEVRWPASGAMPVPVVRDRQYLPIGSYYAPWNDVLARARAEGFF